MILVKCNKDGKVSEFNADGTYTTLFNKMNQMTEDFEEMEIFLVKTKSYNDDLSRQHIFATVKNGWHCVLILTNEWVTLK